MRTTTVSFDLTGSALASLAERPPADGNGRERGEEASTDGVRPDVSILFDETDWTVRRIALPQGGAIPPCRMQYDVVFTVLEGRVVFTTDDSADAGTDERAAAAGDGQRSAGEKHTAEIAAPGAVFIAGGTTTRSMIAVEPSLVLAVLCRGRGASSRLPHEKPVAEP